MDRVNLTSALSRKILDKKTDLYYAIYMKCLPKAKAYRQSADCCLASGCRGWEVGQWRYSKTRQHWSLIMEPEHRAGAELHAWGRGTHFHPHSRWAHICNAVNKPDQGLSVFFPLNPAGLRPFPSGRPQRGGPQSSLLPSLDPHHLYPSITGELERLHWSGSKLRCHQAGKFFLLIFLLSTFTR